MHSAGEDLGSGKLAAELLGLEEVRIGDDCEYRSGPDDRLMESLGQDQNRGLCGDLGDPTGFQQVERTLLSAKDRGFKIVPDSAQPVIQTGSAVAADNDIVQNKTHLLSEQSFADNMARQGAV